MYTDDDYDEDGNNIVPCPLCLSVHCPGKEDGECPEEEEYRRDMDTTNRREVNKTIPK